MMVLRHVAATCMLLTFLVLVCLAVDEMEPAVHFKAGPAGKVEVIATLPPELAKALPAGQLSAEQGEQVLQVFLRHQGKDGPPMLGKYDKKGQSLVFQPSFPLEAGATYGARLLLPKTKTLTAEYKVPELPKGPPTVVDKIWPSADVLPANVLRFYIYFSQPMRGGEEIFSQITILDAKGNPVYDPWLRDELWSEDGKMLIIYIHPGRIKWGVLLRELFGPVLYPDRDYTLKISGDMLDSRSQKLGKDYTKKFKTTAEDRTFIHLKQWTITAPAAGTKQPLLVQCGKYIDHKSLDRYLSVLGPKGKAIVGKTVVGAQEKSWAFHPDQLWQAAEYTLSVDGKLEDVAGNTPIRPFDMDLKMGPPPPQPLVKTFRPVAAP